MPRWESNAQCNFLLIRIFPNFMIGPITWRLLNVFQTITTTVSPFPPQQDGFFSSCEQNVPLECFVEAVVLGP